MNDNGGGEVDRERTLYIRLRGLPFSARDNTVREFMQGALEFF